MHKNPAPSGVVCKPVSTIDPSGSGVQFIKTDYTANVKPSGTYERDEAGAYVINPSIPLDASDHILVDNANNTYVRRDIGTDLEGGNCSWERSDGLVISWNGPLSGHIGPVAPTIAKNNTPANIIGGYDKSLTVNAWSVEGFAVGGDGISRYTGVITNFDRVSYTRWDSCIYCHGKKINVTGQVLGAGMLQNFLVVAVRNGRNSDSILYGKLSELKTTGWKLAGNVPLLDVANVRTVLNRDHVYSFSANGLSFNTLVQVSLRHIPFGNGDVRADNYFLTEDRFAKVVLSGGLILDPLLETISLDSITEITYNDIYNTRFQYDVTHTVVGLRTDYTQTNSTSLVLNENLFCVGFVGNVESRCEISNATLSGSGSGSGHFIIDSFDSSVSGGSTLSESFDITLNGSIVATYDTQINKSSNITVTEDPGTSEALWNGSSTESSTQTAFQPLYCDIANNILILAKTVSIEPSTITYSGATDSSVITGSFTETLLDGAVHLLDAQLFSYNNSSTGDVRQASLGGNVNSRVNYAAKTGVIPLSYSNSITTLKCLVSVISFADGTIFLNIIGRVFDTELQSYVDVELGVIKTPIKQYTRAEFNALFDVTGGVSLIGSADVNNPVPGILFKI
ncbi:MAG: hypothetical protein GQ532_14590 [Methylomarinum sp.]|nr:hypothetical protein [Methylomarinum sp.]